MRFSIGNCDVGLGGEQSIVVDFPEVCRAAPLQLAAADVIGGITIGTGGGGIGAAPALIALVASGGAAAAAIGRGNGNNPASP